MSKWTVNQLYLQRGSQNVANECYRISMKSGVLAAGSVGANDVLYAMRPITPSAGQPVLAYIERFRVQWTCITAFGTPVTAGRALALSGGNNIAAAGGTQLVLPFSKGTNGVAMFRSGLGGDTWIATTGPLTGATVKANAKVAEVSLAGFGTSGAQKDMIWDFTGDDTAPLGISRSDTAHADNTDLVLYAPAAMDAAGTFEIVVEVDVCQIPLN